MDNNSFDNKRIAEGYAKDRPWLHPQVIDLLKSDNKIKSNLQYGLDIGMIQSNVKCQIEIHTKTLEEVRKRFEKGLVTIFKCGKRTLVFEGYSWYIKLKKY